MDTLLRVRMADERYRLGRVDLALPENGPQDWCVPRHQKTLQLLPSEWRHVRAGGFIARGEHRRGSGRRGVRVVRRCYRRCRMVWQRHCPHRQIHSPASVHDGAFTVHVWAFVVRVGQAIFTVSVRRVRRTNARVRDARYGGTRSTDTRRRTHIISVRFHFTARQRQTVRAVGFATVLLHQTFHL